MQLRSCRAHNCHELKPASILDLATYVLLLVAHHTSSGAFLSIFYYHAPCLPSASALCISPVYLPCAAGQG